MKYLVQVKTQIFICTGLMPSDLCNPHIHSATVLCDKCTETTPFQDRFTDTLWPHVKPPHIQYKQALLQPCIKCVLWPLVLHTWLLGEPQPITLRIGSTNHKQTLGVGLLYYWLDPFILVFWVLHLLLNVLMEPRLYGEFSTHRKMIDIWYICILGRKYIAWWLDYAWFTLHWPVYHQ